MFDESVIKNHQETYRKILSVEELPKFQDVIDLLVFSENVYHFHTWYCSNGTSGNPHEDYFGALRLMEHRGEPFMSLSDGGFMKNWVMQICTEEFIDSIVEEIEARNIQGNMLEVGAGRGEISYWLNKRGIPMKATDIKPTYMRNLESVSASQDVETLDCNRALEKYNPELVLTSWLDGGESKLQKAIIDKESVRFYIEIGPNETDKDTHMRFITDQSGYESKRSRLFDINYAMGPIRYSIPACLFVPKLRKIGKEKIYVLSEILEPLQNNPHQFLEDHPTVISWDLKET